MNRKMRLEIGRLMCSGGSLTYGLLHPPTAGNGLVEFLPSCGPPFGDQRMIQYHMQLSVVGKALDEGVGGLSTSQEN